MGTLELLLWLGKVFHAFHIYERRKRLQLAGEIIGQSPPANYAENSQNQQKIAAAPVQNEDSDFRNGCMVSIRLTCQKGGFL
jgi:hypothetical protein